MKVGILGTGDVGHALAEGLISRGHEVMMGAREAGNSKATAWATKHSNGRAHAGDFAQASQFGDLLIVAVKGDAAEAAVRRAGLDHFVGKVVIDAANPLERGPNGLQLFTKGDSLGERLQGLLAQARVVKAFNSINCAHFVEPKFAEGADAYIAGNDAGAKAAVRGILESFGWKSIVDCGDITASRELEALCVLYCNTAIRQKNWKIAFKILSL